MQAQAERRWRIVPSGYNSPGAPAARISNPARSAPRSRPPTPEKRLIAGSLLMARRYRTRVRLSALAGAWTDCQAVQPQNDQRLFRCRHLDRGQSRSTTLKDCGRAGMRAHQRPRRRRAPGFGVSPRSVAALTSPLFGESRQPLDKQTLLKRHLRIEHLAGRVQQGLLDSTELAVHALHITPSSGVGPELSRAALICRGLRSLDCFQAFGQSCTVASRTASRPPAAAKHRSYPAITAAHTRVSRAGPQLSPLASDQPSFLRHDIPAVRSMSRAFLPPRRSLRPRAVSALREPAGQRPRIPR